MKRTYTVDQLKIAIKRSFSWAETLRNMELALSGGAVKSIQAFANENNLDTSHFLGLRWAEGRKRPKLKSKISIDAVLVENSRTSTQRVKQRLFEEGIKKKVCEWCLLDTWRGQPLSLELDHINGISNDHRLENLRILCPNCHAQTDTYRGKNVKRNRVGTTDIKEHFCSCGNKVSRKNVRCRTCYLKNL